MASTVLQSKSAVVVFCLNGFSNLPVGLVDILNSEDGQVAVVSQVAQGDAGTRLDGELIDALLGHIESDGHGEKVAIGETIVLDDAVVVLLGHETCVGVPRSVPLLIGTTT